jgi:hypothetical protein
VELELAIINDAVCADPLSQTENTMRDHTETLSIGSPAPGFTLSAANREGKFSLSDLLSRSPLIIEFARGNW